VTAVGPLVSALDKDHAPSYWFPRDCSRACCCPWTAFQWGNSPGLLQPLAFEGRCLEKI